MHGSAPWHRPHLGFANLPQAHGHSKPVGTEHVGVWALVSFSWIGPLLRLGASGGIEENSASPFIAEADDAAVLARQFERQYAGCQVGSLERQCSSGSGIMAPQLRVAHFLVPGQISEQP